MNPETEQYLDRLKAAIGCPESWQRFNADWEFRRVLFFYWAEIAQNYQAFNEMQYYFQFDALESEHYKEIIKRIEANVPYWRKRAIEEYVTKTAFIKSFRHLNQKEHAKHWVVRMKSTDELAELTKNGPAKYLPRYSFVMLERALYDGVRYNWRRIAEHQIPDLYIEFKKVIGASNGKPASHARFYLNYPNATVHSRPIQPEEKPADEKWLSETDLCLWEGEEDLQLTPVIDEQLEYDAEDFDPST